MTKAGNYYFDPAGKMIGIILNSLLASAIEKPECNEKSWLLKKANMIIDDLK